MTVSTEVSREEYTGNGVTTDFDYRFRVFRAADLVVTVANTSEVITTLALNTDYTVTGAGSRNGGKVKLSTPLAFNWRISIERSLPATQETDVRNQGNFFPEVHEDAWDKLTMLVQQIRSALGLALRKPSWLARYYDALGNRIANIANPVNNQDAATKSYVDSVTNGNLNKTLRVPESYIPPIPSIDGRKNKILAFDNGGNPMPILPESGSAADVMLELARPFPDGAFLVNSAAVTVLSISALLTVPTGRNFTANVSSYHIPSLYMNNAEMPLGSAQYVFNADTPKSKHNGGNIISPTVPWDGQFSTLKNFQSGIGETDPGGTGCWIDISGRFTVWKFGAFPYLNNGVNTGVDSTAQVQNVLVAAKPTSPLTTTHSKSEIYPVFCEGGRDFLIDGHIYFPEGVYLEGAGKVPARLVIGFVTTTSKISGYGRLYDEQQGNPLGTTLTKNWGLRNISIVPNYSPGAPSPSTGIVFDLCYDIEFQAHDVRVIMHKGAVGGGSLLIDGFRFQKCVNIDLFSVTCDGGRYHYRAETSDMPFGLWKSRFLNVFSYNAREMGLLLRNDSKNNTISIFYELQTDVSSGLHYGVNIGPGCSENKINMTAFGDQMTYALILDGTSNYVTGLVSGGTVMTADIRGVGNKVDLNGYNAAIRDTGINSIIDFPGFVKTIGETRGVKQNIAISAADTWVSIAEIDLTIGSFGELRAVFVSADVAVEVVGLGRSGYKSTWFVSHANSSGDISVSEETLFNPNGYAKLRVVPAGANKANLQMSVTGVPVVGPAGVRAATVNYRMGHDQFSRINTI